VLPVAGAVVPQLVDASSEITATHDMDGPVSGPQELAQKLVQSQQVRECYVLQNFRFFHGRDAVSADVCSKAQLLQAFERSNYNIRELLVALTQTDGFLYRPIVQP
jgi:hypothetical protein